MPFFHNLRLGGVALTAALVLSACASGGEKKPLPYSASTNGGIAYYGERPDVDGFPISLKNFDVGSIAPVEPQAEAVSKYGNPENYEVFGKTYAVSDSSQGYKKQGYASWYGTKFHGQRTSSGEPYDMFAMTAANKTLPIPTYVQVKNLENGKTVVVRVNDRGPFHEGRIIDLSYAAAAKLDMLGKGTAKVEVTALAPYQSLDNATSMIADALSTDNTPVFLQAGVFREPANANRLKTKIQQWVMAPVQVKSAEVKGQPVYRVQVGPIDSLTEQQTLLTELAAAGIQNPVRLSPTAIR